MAKIKKNLLKFITDDDLELHTRRVLEKIGKAKLKASINLFSNVIDPFSAIFDASSQGIKLADWLNQEKVRKIQKSFQNALGEFHEYILGSIKGWEKLQVGHVFDIKNDKKKIIAEIKNKYNTTKGNHKVAIYDDLKGQIKNNYNSYCAYYVEIIPKNKNRYDKPFTPSDNRTHRRRAKNNNIRIIDGYSFYSLASGEKDALKKLYEVLPIMVGRILKKDLTKFKSDSLFGELFDKVY